MGRYLVRRILTTIPVLVGIVFIVFTMTSLAPGSTLSLLLSNQAVSAANLERLKEDLGLNEPWYLRFLHSMERLLRGDLGRSLQTHRPVAEMIAEKIGPTVRLTVFSCFLAVMVALPLGILAAARRRSVFDYLATALALLGVSMPSFYLGLLLILLFGLKLHWLPIRGLPSYDATLLNQVRYLILPSVTLGAALTGILTRMTRASMIEALGQDFARTARAKGQSRLGVLVRHALPNAFLPILTTLGLQFGSLLGGAVIIETIFSLPGLGLLAINAVKFRDIPLIEGTVLVFAVSFVAVMLVVDLLYMLVDPRIRLD